MLIAIVVLLCFILFVLVVAVYRLTTIAKNQVKATHALFKWLKEINDEIKNLKYNE